MVGALVLAGQVSPKDLWYRILLRRCHGGPELTVILSTGRHITRHIARCHRED